MPMTHHDCCWQNNYGVTVEEVNSKEITFRKSESSTKRVSSQRISVKDYGTDVQPLAMITNPDCAGGVGETNMACGNGSSFNTRYCLNANGQWAGEVICSDANGSFDNIDLNSAGSMTHGDCCWQNNYGVITEESNTKDTIVKDYGGEVGPNAMVTNPNCAGGVGTQTISCSDGNYQSSFNTRICYNANGEWTGEVICSDANGSFDNIDLSSAGSMTHGNCCWGNSYGVAVEEVNVKEISVKSVKEDGKPTVEVRQTIKKR